ncbi:MAG TPA: DUF998 domain-containing protein [Microbacteriaceae bacterium]|nr:DUF998 domain-containing protein [Microbacteriaceae bacterium]
MTSVKPVARIAFIAAIIGPIQNIAGWALAGALWPGYDAVRLTISDLASPQSPVRWVMTSFFVLGSTLILIAALYARPLALPGRMVLFVAALCSYGLTIFPTPLNGVSEQHRFFAILFFAASASWQLFAMRFRPDAPWVLRPVAIAVASIVQAALAITFLVIWADPSAVNVGVWERVVSFVQSSYLSFVVLVCVAAGRRKVRYIHAA